MCLIRADGVNQLLRHIHLRQILWNASHASVRVGLLHALRQGVVVRAALAVLVVGPHAPPLDASLNGNRPLARCRLAVRDLTRPAADRLLRPAACAGKVMPRDGHAPTTAAECRITAPRLEVFRDRESAFARMKPRALRHRGREGWTALCITGPLHLLQGAQLALGLDAAGLLCVGARRTPLAMWPGLRRQGCTAAQSQDRPAMSSAQIDDSGQ